MTDFIITSPEGNKYKVSAPPGKTEQDALAYVKQNHDSLKALPVAGPAGVAGQAEAEAVHGPNDRNPAPTMPYAEGDPNLSLHDIGEAGKGAVASVLGTPGDIEKAGIGAIRRGVNTFNKKVLGSPTRLPEEDTIFPTSDSIGKMLFEPPQDQRDQGYRQLGGVVGSVASPGAIKGVITAGKALPMVASRILPGGTARAVDKLTKLGLPDTPSTLGQTMHETLTKRLTTARNERSTETAQNFANFTGKAETAKPILDEYQKHIVDTIRSRSADLSSEEKQVAAQSLKELRGDKSLEAIDKERRRLRGIADSGPLQGHSAVKKIFADELADKLEEVMTKNNESFGPYLKNYQQASEPINLYKKTLLGQAATKEGPTGMPITDAAQLPAKFFKSAQSIGTLKQLSGDDAFVEAAARIHAASEMERLTTGKSIDAAAARARDWYAKNRSWLAQVGPLNADVEKYVKNLQGTAATQRNAKIGAGVGAVSLLLAEGERPYYWIRHLLGIP